MPAARRRPGAPRRRVAPWKRTEKDRGYMRRKKTADARAAARKEAAA